MYCRWAETGISAHRAESHEGARVLHPERKALERAEAEPIVAVDRDEGDRWVRADHQVTVSPPTETRTPLAFGSAAVPKNAWTSPRSRSATSTDVPSTGSTVAA